MVDLHEATRNAASLPILLCHGIGKHHINFMFGNINFISVCEDHFLSYMEEATIYVQIYSRNANYTGLLCTFAFNY